MSTFPPELKDLVIGHMQGEKDTLASCGLVSRAWLHLSRPYLFGSVTLRDHTYEDFLRLKASRHCTFIPAIRTLSISRPQTDEETDSPFTELVSQLTGLPSLTCLRVFYVSWIHLSDPSLTAFISAFRDITELDIERAAFIAPHHLIAMLARLPRLEKVSVHTTFIEDEAPAREPLLLPPPDPPRKLQHVRLCMRSNDGDSFSPLINWIGTGPPTVCALELSILWSRSLPAVGRLLRALGPVLRSLDLKLLNHVTSHDVDTDLAPPLALSTHIAHLTIHIALRRFHAPNTPPHAPWALLAALPHAPAALETLTIVLTIDFMYMIGALDWAHFNAALRARARLRRLQFRVHCNHAIGAVAEEIRKRIAPEFVARGSVEVMLLQSGGVFT
ncbi:hypothetical protein GGX14DRAFT_450317 [Mycena pura]|uniref:F-box domain-containing protein n=1 Tax=Mycena pura TaxID=153505 RepID=A0AAD6VIR7_9AGAR|nr:hypothetical protein GGX14DRAFT_450317 [Mycena pura]